MNSSVEHEQISLEELNTLASLPADERWQRLLSRLTEVFVNQAGDFIGLYGEEFSNVVCNLLKRVNVDARKDLSDRVAQLESFPPTVVRKLATDEYEVAASVLEHSPVLSDSDLIAMLSAVMNDHMLSISRRQSLGPRLTDALVKRENTEIIHELAANAGAKMSETTYRAVAEMAKKDKKLQEFLVARGDMSPTVVVQLAPFLSPELMEKLHRPDDGGGLGLLDSLNDVLSDTSVSEPSEGVQETADVESLLEKVREQGGDASAISADLADKEQFRSLCEFVGGLSGLGEKAIAAHVSSKKIMPIAVICKGLGLTCDAFEAICFLRSERMRLPQSENVLHIDQYQELKTADAKKSLAVLQAKAAKA